MKTDLSLLTQEFLCIKNSINERTAVQLKNKRDKKIDYVKEVNECKTHM
jgi:hypothetical protein